MGSRIKNAKRNIIGGLIRRMVMMLFPFVVRSVLIYKLGALYLGLNSLFSSILQVLSLAELGFGEAMVFAMYEPIAEEDDITIRALLGLYRKIYSGIGVVILSVGLVILPFLPRFISGEIPEQVNIYVLFLVYLINTCISYFLYAYKTSVLIADQRSDIFSNISTICSIIMYSLQILALLVTHNYYIYCILIPITTILNNLIIQIVTKKLYPQYYCDGQLDNSITKEIKKRVFGVFVFKVCSVFRNSFDSIVISAFLGLVVLGKYQNYFYIINSVMGIMIVLTSSITAGVGNSIIIDSKDKNYDDFIKFQFIFFSYYVYNTKNN